MSTAAQRKPAEPSTKETRQRGIRGISLSGDTGSIGGRSSGGALVGWTGSLAMLTQHQPSCIGSKPHASSASSFYRRGFDFLCTRENPGGKTRRASAILAWSESSAHSTPA